MSGKQTLVPRATDELLRELEANPLDAVVLRLSIGNVHRPGQILVHLVRGLLSGSSAGSIYVIDLDRSPNRADVERYKELASYREGCRLALRALRRAGLDPNKYLEHLEASTPPALAIYRRNDRS